MSLVTIRRSCGSSLRSYSSSRTGLTPSCNKFTISFSSSTSSFTLRSLRLPKRQFSSSSYSSGAQASSGAAAHGVPAAVGPLSAITSELDRLAPRFQVRPSQITIIRTPAEFYETLKLKIRTAKRRIFLATLYIGKSEHELISCLQEALRANPDLKLSVLTDALRGTREAPDPSCASLLLPLVTEFGEDRVELRMFHTPNLNGLRKKIVPKRVNEGWGLQHMKLYGMDDEIILSGANLSSDYFTNRQDRYHLISSPDVTDYFAGVHNAICRLSFKLRPVGKFGDEKGIDAKQGFETTWEKTNAAPSPLEDPNAFVSASTKFLSTLTVPQESSLTKQSGVPASSSGVTDSTTFIYPLLQLTPLMKPSRDCSNELPALRRVFTILASSLSPLDPSTFSSSSFSSPSSPQPSTPPQRFKWVFTAGYFNMTPEFRSLLLSTNPESGTVIAASPWANGFYGSKGVSGMLPAAYTLMARRFLEAVTKTGGADLASKITLREWRRGTVNEPGGWTYHAKGFWLSFSEPQSAQNRVGSGEETSRNGRRSRTERLASTDASHTSSSVPSFSPCLTIVGSSNYTKRSHTLDIEANAMIVTKDKGLQARLAEEVAWLEEHSKPVTIEEFQRTERRVSLHVRLAVWIVGLLGGAL